MQVLATPAPSRPHHSLSYNDLKKRRLQRSVSQNKMTIPQPSATNSKRRNLTQKKSLVSNLPKDEKVIEGVINELKHVLGDIRRKKSQNRFFSLRQSMTERPPEKQKQKPQATHKKEQPLWSNVEESGQTKQFIRLLLNKNKSQRRLIKFNEVRDKFKMQKQRSRSKSKSITVKEVVSPYKQRTAEKHGLIQEVIAEDINKETLKIQAKTIESSSLDEQLDKLTSCAIEVKETIWKDEISGKQNQERINFSIDANEISQIKKNEQIDDSCFYYKKLLEKTQLDGSFLRLLKTGNELEHRVNSRETKRRGEIERLRRIFPVGFFAN